ncbi:isoprenoid biosynthesis glyoxalase ElbB [Myxococcota bacterium]|nr:isoprenoid biosynthesis glyoxalase ElbB [Myxococcota bacterium]
MKKVGVILSGCGFQDGAEIHEAVLALLALDRAGAKAVCLAPNVDQAVVVDHLTGKPVAEKRNVLVESARIARGEITDLAKVKAADLDALVLPGGYGAAMNLSNFAEKGPASTVHPDVARIIREIHDAKKPIAAICISPALIAKVLGDRGVRLTIGNDEGTAKAVEGCGAKHENCPTERFVLDADHKLITTPAYMLGPSLRHVAAGIELTIAELLRMA